MICIVYFCAHIHLYIYNSVYILYIYIYDTHDTRDTFKTQFYL